MTLPIHDLISPSYRQEFPESYRELLLKTCQEFDRDCTRDIIRIYASVDRGPEHSIGTHIDRMLALESALEEAEDGPADGASWEGPPMHYVHTALHKVRNNLHELAHIVLGG